MFVFLSAFVLQYLIIEFSRSAVLLLCFVAVRVENIDEEKWKRDKDAETAIEGEQTRRQQT